MPTTEELVKAVRKGDKAAFAQLVGLYQRAAIITAQAVLGDLDLIALEAMFNNRCQSTHIFC